jgi:hypothetical protein
MPLGDFTASNLIGPVRLSTRSRDIQISDFTNSLEITVEGRGDIELRPGSVPLARTDVHTRSGDIELSLPPSAKFDLTASTERGDVTNDFGDPLKLEHHGPGATLRGSSGGPTMSVRTERGQVTVRRASADDKPLEPRGELPKSSKTPLPPAALKKIEQ